MPQVDRRLWQIKITWSAVSKKPIQGSTPSVTGLYGIVIGIVRVGT